MAILGHGINQAFITTRGGARIVGELSNANNITWNRALDDSSEAEVQTPNQSFLRDVHCWANELLIVRNDDEVWHGPIVNVKRRRDSITFQARDVLVHLERRLLHQDLIYEGVNAKDLVQIAYDYLVDAFAPDDPDVIRHITIRSLAGSVVERRAKLGEAHLEQFREFARSGVDFTTIGRRIVISGENETTPVAALRDDHIIGEIEEEERGMEQGTLFRVKGTGAVASYGGVDPSYGLLERLVAEDSILTTANALAVATARQHALSRPPTFINIQQDSRLGPQAPVTIKQLVPGVVLTVSIDQLDQPRTQDFKLLQVQVSQNGGEDGSQDEFVTLQLSPVGYYEAGLGSL